MKKTILALASLLALSLAGAAIAASDTPTTGDDHIRGTKGDDTIDALAGNDRVEGRAGDDKLSGSEGNDRLKGDRGKDDLDGGPGDDRIHGGKGKDSLKGGDGADRLHARDHRPDTIDCGADDGDRDVVKADRKDTVTNCGEEDKVRVAGARKHHKRHEGDRSDKRHKHHQHNKRDHGERRHP